MIVVLRWSGLKAYSTPSVKMNKDSCKAAFTARVHRYLYSKDSNDESEEIEIAGIIDNTHHAATSFDPRPDPRDKLLERREEFIRSQLAIVKRMQLKGILSVSSKQSVEEPATTCTSEPVGFGDECSAEKGLDHKACILLQYLLPSLH